MIRITTLTLASTLAFGAFAGWAVPASAGDVDETFVRAGSGEIRSERVQFSRAELATAEGRLAVQLRIERSAKLVCGPLGARAAGGLRLAARNYECYRQAVDSALSQIDGVRVAGIDG